MTTKTSINTLFASVTTGLIKQVENNVSSKTTEGFLLRQMTAGLKRDIAALGPNGDAPVLLNKTYEFNEVGSYVLRALDNREMTAAVFINDTCALLRRCCDASRIGNFMAALETYRDCPQSVRAMSLTAYRLSMARAA